MGVELLALAPHRKDLTVSGVSGVVGQQDAGFPQRLPEVGEHRVGRRAVTELGAHGARLHDDHPSTLGKGPFQLAHRILRVRQREVRGREDALLVVEAPVLFHPPVEGAERGSGGRQIVLERLLHADREGREEVRTREALLVHHADPRVTILVFGTGGLELTEELDHAGAGLVLAAEVVLEAARRRQGVEGRVA